LAELSDMDVNLGDWSGKVIKEFTDENGERSVI
jgi:hypothetical protein